MILTFRPIKVWPDGWQRADRERQHSPFDSTYSKTLSLLDRELEHLHVLAATLQVDARPNQIRSDGQLRSDARVDHPGVILALDTKNLGSLVYSCDRYVIRWSRNGRADWHENLRAIALGLEALRKVERYGIANRGEQYAGYREIGTGIPMGSEPVPTMSADEAARFMAQSAWPNDKIGHQLTNVDMILGDPDMADLAYKLGAKRLHPDVGGEPAEFRRLGEARRIVAMASR